MIMQGFKGKGAKVSKGLHRILVDQSFVLLALCSNICLDVTLINVLTDAISHLDREDLAAGL